MRPAVNIEGRMVGIGQKCFIVGEIGSNHNLDQSIVKELIDAAAAAGFDAVKFQLYDAEEAFSKKEMTTDVKLDHLYGVRPWWEIARDRILMPRDWFAEMFRYARDRNLIPFATVHRSVDAEFLVSLDTPVFKIASIDLHYHFLLRELIKYNKPFIISTGMAYLSEIDETLRLLDHQGAKEVVLLHCVSCYPPSPEMTNLRNVETFRKAFEIPVGFSDHSTGLVSAVAAVALGAVLIEKHITIDKTLEGPDHPFALDIEEMHQLVAAVREVEASLGDTRRILSEAELDARRMIRRSVVTREPIKQGERITLEKIKFARPGRGISPNEFRYLEGRESAVDMDAEEVIGWEMIRK